MKKLLIIPILSILFFSCEEDFDPKTAYKEKYALNCILRGDTTLQYATILRSYSVSGFDPYENTANTFISGADVRIWQGNKVYILRDTLLPRTDTSRYKEPIAAYYTRDFIPADNTVLEIRAILTTGKELSAASKMPGTIEFIGEGTDGVAPVSDRNYFTFTWKKKTSYAYYMPRLIINYVYLGGLDEERRTVFMPLQYNTVNGQLVPEYPNITRSNVLTFYNHTLDTVFARISQGDPQKSNYAIIGAVLEVLEFDKPLSEYYSSLNGYLDDFTIRVDEKDYTNINGGFGIFGSYVKARRGLNFKESYITSFGYKIYTP